MNDEHASGPTADAVRRQLGSLVAAHGPEILDDSRRVRAMLADSVADSTAESNLLGLALSAGVATRLRAAGSDPSAVRRAVEDAVSDLQRTSSVQARDARWAVTCLAEALGMSSPASERAVAAATGRTSGPGSGPDDLVVRSGAREIVVEAGTVATVGRDPDCTVVLDEPSVSRQHARITRAPSGWEYHDLGSTQGSFVGGMGVTTTAITAETEVRLGQGPGSVSLVLAPFGSAPTRVPPDRLRPAVGIASATELPQGAARPGGVLGSGGAPRTELGGSGGGADDVTVTLAGTSRAVPPGRTLTIGREADASNDLVATHPTVSRQHVRVEHRQGRWHLVDLGTTSGTWLDGVRVSDIVLGGRQEVVIGDRERGDRVVLQTAAAAGGPAGAAAGSGPGRSRRTAAILALVGAATVVAVVAGVLVLRSIGGDDEPVAAAKAPAGMSRDDLARATVYLESDLGTGSGVIVDKKQGLILTNAHVAAPSAVGLGVTGLEFSDEQQPNPDRILVSVSDGLDQAAEPTFTATVVTVDGYLDVAVLKLDKRLSGAPVDEDDLSALSQVRLGDSDDVGTADDISFFGYPAAADSTAPTFTTGVVSGPVQDDRLSSARAEINTTATSSFGNSGGLAVDDDGDMVGVPTWGRPDSSGQVVFSSIRPINLAKPVIEAARTGQAYTSTFSQPGPASAQVSDVGFAQPGAPGQIAPGCADGSSGQAPLSITVDYTGFPTGPHTDVAARWYDADGRVVASSVAPYPTVLPANGCMTMTFDTVLDPGVYRLKIGVGGDLHVVFTKRYELE